MTTGALIGRRLGLSPDELYAAQAPFALRADAWLHRAERLRRPAAGPDAL